MRTYYKVTTEGDEPYWGRVLARCNADRLSTAKRIMGVGPNCEHLVEVVSAARIAGKLYDDPRGLIVEADAR